MKKAIISEYKINSLITYRWSPRAFIDKPIEKDRIQSILEAARWAPSAFNEQPWRFIVGIKGDETYERVLETLVEWNQKWAGKASMLVVNIAKKTFSKNGKQNVTFKYDLGQAVAFMCLEAMNQGVYSHQMSGFSPEKADELFHIPDDYQAVSVTAFGYYGDPDQLPEEMYKSEIEERSRQHIDKMIYASEFGAKTNLF